MQTNKRYTHCAGHTGLMAGFTMLELMTVVAIAGILMAIGIPAYQDMVRNNCLVTNTNLLVSSMQLARSEAIKNRADTVITSAAGGWQGGWTITQMTTPGNNRTIRTVTPTCVNTIITQEQNQSTFTYTANGRITAGGVTRNLRFNVCDNRTGENGFQVTVTVIGRPQSGGNVCS